jgi:hypothetical protein
MQHVEGSGTPVLYIGRTVLKGYRFTGHAVAHLAEAQRYKPEGRGFLFLMVSLEFFIDIIFPAALWP